MIHEEKISYSTFHGEKKGPIRSQENTLYHPLFNVAFNNNNNYCCGFWTWSCYCFLNIHYNSHQMCKLLQRLFTELCRMSKAFFRIPQDGLYLKEMSWPDMLLINNKMKNHKICPCLWINNVHICTWHLRIIGWGLV